MKTEVLECLKYLDLKLYPAAGKTLDKPELEKCIENLELKMKKLG